MVDVYNKNAQASEVTKDKIKAIRLDLKGDDEELEGKKFDFITVSPLEFLPRIMLSQWNDSASGRTIISMTRRALPESL